MQRIPLRAQDGSIRAYAIVDDADFEWLNQSRWCRHSRGYAGRRQPMGGGQWILMHREILGLPRASTSRTDSYRGPEVDHRNGDRLDNRRENLRVTTRSGNAQNKRLGPLRGASRTKEGRWRARVQLQGVGKQLGEFDTAEEAAAVAAAWRAEHMPYSPEARAA